MGVDPKVHSEFSIRCWMLWKNASKLFDQPNICVIQGLASKEVICSNEILEGSPTEGQFPKE